jgi:hypothetical protein
MKEFEWTLIGDGGELFGAGTVMAENKTDAYTKALNSLEAKQRTAVLQHHFQLNCHLLGE